MTALTARKSHGGEDRASYRAACLVDLYWFAKVALGNRDMTDAFHLPMLRWSQNDPSRKKLHMAPRGTYKSSGLDVAKTVQFILGNPDKCTLLASNKAENAQKFLTEIKGHLQNEKLIWAFGDILWTTPREMGDNYLKGALTVKRPKGLRPRKEATVDTNGVEGELVSNHYERGVFDDIVGFENSQTRPERMKVIDWYEAAQALVDQPTPAMAWLDIIGTPFDYDDAYAHLLNKRKRGEINLAVYAIPCWVRDPNGIDVPGRGPMRATFPEKLSIPTLIQMRKTMPLRFSSQYELTPADQDSAVFKRLPADLAHPYGIPVVKPTRERPPLADLWLAITIDPAISVKGWADYSALTVCGWDHANTQHVLWLKWGKWSETQLIDETYLAFNHFAGRGQAPAVVGFEAVAFQRLYLHLFRSAGEKRNQFLPITKLERDTKNTKQTRQLVLEPGWNAGEIVFYDDLDALDDLLDMASKFRTHKELTRDDLLDVLADNHQLRVRPNLPEAAPGITDPALVADLAVEALIQTARRDRKAAPLSEPDLALARLQTQTLDDADAQRLVTTGAFGDLFG